MLDSARYIVHLEQAVELSISQQLPEQPIIDINGEKDCLATEFESPVLRSLVPDTDQAG